MHMFTFGCCTILGSLHKGADPDQCELMWTSEIQINVDLRNFALVCAYII